jgi:hypothetical protein
VVPVGITASLVRTLALTIVPVVVSVIAILTGINFGTGRLLSAGVLLPAGLGLAPGGWLDLPLLASSPVTVVSPRPDQAADGTAGGSGGAWHCVEPELSQRLMDACPGHRVQGAADRCCRRRRRG